MFGKNVIIRYGGVEIPTTASVISHEPIEYSGKMDITKEDVDRIRAAMPEIVLIDFSEETKQAISDMVYEKTGDRVEGVELVSIEDGEKGSTRVNLKIEKR